MFQPAHKLLPPADYVSLIRSLYADRLSMLLGAYGSALAAGVAALESGSPSLAIIAMIFIAVGAVRHFDMRAFADAYLADDDVPTAIYWERRATIGAAAIAAVYGTWCLLSFWVVDNAFAELTAASVSVSVLVGVAQRNFAIDRLMTIQVLLIAVPLSIGLLLTGDIFYALLTLLLFPFFASLRKIAGNSRNVLLRAVHGRTTASALAVQLDTALDTLAHGLLMLDANRIIEVANDTALQAFGISEPNDWIGCPLSELFDHALETGAMSAAAARRMQVLIETGASGKVLINNKAGHYFEATISSRDAKVVLLFEDISDRIAAEERISHMARFDALTGLPNRAHFAHLVQSELEARLDKIDVGAVALFILDLDDFKHINDTLGHLAGDHLLAEVGARLPAVLPRDAIVGRLGGDEFIAFYVSHGNEDVIEADARRVVAALEQPFRLPNRELTINVSLGSVCSAGRGDDFEQLMIKADLALNAAKSGGKNRIVQFHARMDTEYQLRQQLKIDLKAAIAEGELELAYQPIVDPHENRVVGCEALARWKHPTLGTISPGIFIPIAEETGMITDLTRFVLAKALGDCRSWPDDMRVAVNISARDFRSCDVGDLVSLALERAGLSPERLEIEVTETTVIQQRDAAATALLKLSKLGVGIALDDFGTGYSSLSYLSALPFTKLKIDRSFLEQIETDAKGVRLLANVVKLGKDLDLTVTIEGVETDRQLELVTQETEVDLIQGFLFGAPLSYDAISRLLERQHSRQTVVPLRVVSTGS